VRSVMESCRDYADSIASVHVRDIDPKVLRQGVAQSCDYGTFSRHGIFAELGEGLVTCRGCLMWSRMPTARVARSSSPT